MYQSSFNLPDKNLSVNICSMISLLKFWDWVVFIAFAGITGLSIWYGEKIKQKGGESLLDFLVMGRRLTLPLFTATLVATWYGGIFGVTRIAFETGIYNFITQGLFWYISYVIFALFIVDKASQYHAITLPDLVGKMFGSRSAKVAGIFNFFNVLPITYVISLGLLLQSIFGGTLWVMMSLGVLIVLGYSLWGGLRAVVFSDVIQFFTMCMGVFLVLAFSVLGYGGWGFLKENLPNTHFSLTGGLGWGATLAWGLIALSTLVDPNFYQRCFAARTPRVAKKGILLSTGVWFCFDVCTTLGAMYARAVMPEASPENAYLIYALQVLPEGLRGLMLAGILATILSTLDSYLFLSGTTIGFDLLPDKWKGKLIWHRLGMVGAGILSVVVATFFGGNIKAVWKTLGSYSAACLLFPVLYGYAFPGKIRDNQFVFACVLGVVATTWWRSLNSGLDELYIGLFATAVGLEGYSMVKHYFFK